jgi:hypothetical protein
MVQTTLHFKSPQLDDSLYVPVHSSTNMATVQTVEIET